MQCPHGVVARRDCVGQVDDGLLGYLDFRFPEIHWRADHPNLSKLYDKLMLRASFIDTQPV